MSVSLFTELKQGNCKNPSAAVATEDQTNRLRVHLYVAKTKRPDGLSNLNDKPVVFRPACDEPRWSHELKRETSGVAPSMAGRMIVPHRAVGER